MSVRQPYEAMPSPTGKRAGLPRATGASRLLVALAACLCVWAGAARAVQPSEWVHTTEADFQPGDTEETVVTNLGDVKLATSTEALGEVPEEVTVINELLQVSASVYIAGGPKGRLLEWRDGEMHDRVTLETGQIFALATDSLGRLLVGVSDETSYIATITDGELEKLAELPEVRYIWDIVPDHEHLIVATGTEGKVLRVTLGGDEPKIEELLDAAQDNALCLGIDDFGRIYAGTDTDGLIYRFAPRPDGTVKAFVLYDAPEPEIGALVVRGDGVVYAGTADAEQARPGRLEEAAAQEAGRPEGPTVPADAPDEGEAPEPGDLPNVEPRPEPIGAEGGDVEGDAAAPEADAAGDAPQAGEGDNGEAPAPVVPGGDAGEGDADIGDGPAEGGTLSVRQMFSQSLSRRSSPTADPLRQRIASAMQEGGDKPAAPAAPADAQESAEDDAAADEAAPTPEQFNQMRQVIRERLMKARKTGELQVEPGQRPQRRPGMAARPAAGAQRPGAQPTKQGNAIYRIDPDGFVTEVFRESVMILDILDRGDSLLVATGSEGQLFSVSPQAEETSILVDLDSEQIPAMLVMPPVGDEPGAIVLGTANPAGLVEVGRGFATEGTYTSVPLDASQISLWGKMHVATRVAEAGTLVVETRSGNVADPEHAPWSDWSEAGSIAFAADADPLSPHELSVISPPARFLQYRLKLSGDGEQTTAVDRVQMTYVTPNLRPSITAVQAQYAGQQGTGGPGARPSRGGEVPEPSAPTGVNLSWEASDPNSDPLIYTLQYQSSAGETWITLEEDLRQNSFEWKTRLVPDGRYRVRVIASDAPANPGGMADTARRISEPILVDNTPPTIENLKKRAVDGNLLVTFTARDELAGVRAVHYAIDAGDEYHPVLPDDLIFDSTSETITVRLTDLSPDPHTLTIRVLDGLGNARFEALHVQPRRDGEQAK